MALLSWLFGISPRPNAISLAGLAGGFAGVGLLVGPALSVRGGGGESPHAWIGMSILLCSSLIWSAGSLYSRSTHTNAPPFLAAGQQMLCGGGLMLLVGIAKGELAQFHPGDVTAQSLGAFTYLVLVGGVIGYASYAWLLRHSDPAKVATYAYVNPIVAVLLGTLFADEKLSMRMVLAAVLIIGSVALVITSEQLKKTETDALASSSARPA
jgi:drug/metabolite transporter (DMT)-like permease